MTELPTGTVTFLFMDLEGSTRLWEEHPEAIAVRGVDERERARSEKRVDATAEDGSAARLADVSLPSASTTATMSCVVRSNAESRDSLRRRRTPTSSIARRLRRSWIQSMAAVANGSA